MSINVNVSGNPICIRRGKMVAADPDFARKDFQKRRLIRLQQVRQQSKDIAADIRDKVRRAKTKHLSDIEKLGEKELKKWQARKLLDLQQQYRNCLKDIGLGHAQAIIDEESDDIMLEQLESYELVSKARGKDALQQVRDNLNRIQEERENRKEMRKYNQAVENARSSVIINTAKNKNPSPFKKKKTKKKVNADLIIEDLSSEGETVLNVPLNTAQSEAVSDYHYVNNEYLESDSKVPENEPSQDAVSTGRERLYSVDTRISDRINSRRIRAPICELTNERNFYNLSSNSPKQSSSKLVDGEAQTTFRGAPLIQKRSSTSYMIPFDTDCESPKSQLPFKPKLTIKTIAPTSPPLESRFKPKLTMITNAATSCVEPPYKPKLTRSTSPPIYTEDLPSRPKLSMTTNAPIYVEELPVKPKLTMTTRVADFSEEIPSKPKLAMTSNRAIGTNGSGGPKVKHYDHRNRFSKEYEAPISSVRKVDDDSLEVCPSVDSEPTFVENMYKRDKEAEVRGQRALEKVRAQQDYKEMMEKLPRLQKTERIAALSTNRPESYMSEDRLKESNRKRQHRLENAYEKLFPRGQTITIPPKEELLKHSNSLRGDPETMARWAYDKPTTDSVMPIGSLLKKTEEQLQNGDVLNQKKESLQKMLKSLTEQRDKLVTELQSIPQDSNLHKVLGGLSIIDEVIESGRKTTIKDNRASENKGASKVTSKPLKKPETQIPKPTVRPKKRNTAQTRIPSPTAKVAPRPISPKPSTSKQSPPQQSISRQSALQPSTSKTPTTKATSSKSSTSKSADKKPKQPKKVSSKPSTVQQYPCKYIQSSDSSSNQDSYNSRKLSPSDMCRCGRSKDEPADDTCECKEFHPKIQPPFKSPGTKTVTYGPVMKVDAAVEASTSTVDKAVTTVTISKGTDCTLCGTNVKRVAEPCEIVIKICDEGNHKISVSPKKKKGETTAPCPVESKTKPASKSNTTWKEVFSQNSCESTSTSYYSPPDAAFQSAVIVNRNTSTAKNILKNKPQQRNLNDSSVIMSPRKSVKIDDRALVRHIKQLLNMSRGSVDELAVSTVSDVSTPGSSIINVEANHTDDRFEKFLKRFTIDVSSNSTSQSCESKSAPGSCNVDASKSTPGVSIRNQTIDEYVAENYPDILEAYNKIAETCVQKIDNLAARFEDVHLPGSRMFDASPTSDKDNSTKYYEPPSNSPEQQRLNKQLLQIKPPTQASEPENGTNASTDHSTLNFTNQEILDRFYKLKDAGDRDKTKMSTVNVTSETSPPPIWLSIPRLPPFPEPSLHNDMRSATKPPLSKGIIAAKAFNKDITAVPHELSEIPEVDSFTKSTHSKSLVDSVSKILPPSELIASDSTNSQSTMSVPDILNGIDSPIQVLNTEALKVRSQPEPIKNIVSESSSNEMESIETTLKRLGMGWAVTTIKKTQKALALTSTSSSSLETQSNSISENGNILPQISSDTLLTSRDSSNALSTFLRGLIDGSQNPDSVTSGNKTSRKTSTPVHSPSFQEERSRKSNQPNLMGTAESELSSIKQTSNDAVYDHSPFYSLIDATANQTKDGSHQ